MSGLLLESFQIEGYRLFQKLVIPSLGRVNLITGKNNVGKTAVLEALRLYAERAAPRTLLEILAGREELEELSVAAEADVTGLLAAFGSLFPGRPDPSQPKAPLRIGPVQDEENTLLINPGWFETRAGEVRYTTPGLGGPDLEIRNIRPSLEIRLGKRSARLWFDQFHEYARGALLLPDLEDLGRITCLSVPPAGLNARTRAEMWDRITLTDLEGAVVEAIRSAAPDVERLSLVSTPTPSAAATTTDIGAWRANTPSIPLPNGAYQRSFRVRSRQMPQPFPLRSMGDGVNRALGLSLALVNAHGGFLLVDEFENGLHYTVQVDLWKHVFRIAQKLNVQVFATTHSYDCITAFQEAAGEHDEEGVLVRLQERQGEHRATVFDEEDLAVIANKLIEVR